MFVDYQNTYMGARRAFGEAGFTDGQVYPRRLGIAVTQLGREVDASRQLEFVKVFRGEPSPAHSPTGQAACQRQVRFWAAQNCVEAVTRPLKYYADGWDPRAQAPKWRAQEKGIDVLIALAMVTGAMKNEYDVAVLMSADTDLAPAVEQVLECGKRVEVAAWKSRDVRSRLALTGQNIWCHWLTKQWYERLHDPSDYTMPQPGDPPVNP